MLVNEDADLLPFDVDVDDHSNLDTTVVKEKQSLASSLYLIKMRIWYQSGPGRGQSPTSPFCCQVPETIMKTQ